MRKRPNNWLLRWAARAPSRWLLGRRSPVRETLRGSRHLVAYVRHLARGNRSLKVAKVEIDVEAAAVRRRPVLILHGFLGTRGSMYVLERRLWDDGFTVFSFNLGTFNSRDIRRSALLIHRKIEATLAQTGVDEIDIVAHSMGGLIGLYYIKKLGGNARVRKLIMMGSPVNGTWAALAGVATLGLWSTSSWQLLPRSRFLDELHHGPLPNDVEIVSLAAINDAVCPIERTRLRGAKSVTVPLGHSSLVVSPRVYERIRGILNDDTSAGEP